MQVRDGNLHYSNGSGYEEALAIPRDIEAVGTMELSDWKGWGWTVREKES